MGLWIYGRLDQFYGSPRNTCNFCYELLATVVSIEHNKSFDYVSKATINNKNNFFEKNRAKTSVINYDDTLNFIMIDLSTHSITDSN